MIVVLCRVVCACDFISVAQDRFRLTGLILGIGGLVSFAVLYSLGNICSIGSTLFLMGPVSQLKKMFASTRIIATIVMIVALILTLVSAFALNDTFLCFLFIIIQFFAMLWYSLSYIPFARDAVKKVAGSIIA